MLALMVAPILILNVFSANISMSPFQKRVRVSEEDSVATFATEEITRGVAPPGIAPVLSVSNRATDSTYTTD